MIADGSIGDHAKKTEKEDGESSFLVCFGCRAAKIRAEMKEHLPGRLSDVWGW